MPRQFPPEFLQRALRLVEESLGDHETEYAAVRHVASKGLVGGVPDGGRAVKDVAAARFEIMFGR
jgi:hypothetical protein